MTHSALFDQMICELGDLVRLRDAALRQPEIACAPPVTAALDALKVAVSAVGCLAQARTEGTEVDVARRALADARRLFGDVIMMLAEAR